MVYTTNPFIHHTHHTHHTHKTQKGNVLFLLAAVSDADEVPKGRMKHGGYRCTRNNYHYQDQCKYQYHYQSTSISTSTSTPIPVGTWIKEAGNGRGRLPCTSSRGMPTCSRCWTSRRITARTSSGLGETGLLHFVTDECDFQFHTEPNNRGIPFETR